MSKKITDNKVSQYYDTTYAGYSLGWSPQYIHYGFWDPDTKSHEESLQNTIRYVAEFLNLSSDERVLDAGCGVGSASRFIAENYGAEVHGIMNSKVMLQKAREFKSKFSNPELVKFDLMDYNDTKFDDEYFTRIFGLESVCYAKDKKIFSKEMFRLLQDGGKLVIADGYRMRNDLDEEEREIYEKWLEGWVLPDLIQPHTFIEILENTGFDKVEYHDMTDKIQKSSQRMYNQTRFTRIIQYILMKLRVNDPINYYSTRSGYLQKYLVDNNIMGYGILTAQKL